MYATSYFNPSAVTAGNRYQLHVGGNNFSNRADVRLGALSISLQGPGGQSTMRFTVEMTSSGSSAPFLGRAPVFFRDTSSDLKFRGFITHTTFRRSQGRKVVIDVDVAGLDKQLDERLVVSFKTRPDTTQGVVSRKHKYDNDDALVKGILSLPNVKLHSLIGSGNYIQQTQTSMDDMTFKGVTVREALQQIADVAQSASQYQTRRFYVDDDGILHYYRGFESDSVGVMTAPFRINEDDRYIRTMLTASGVASFWSGRLNGAGDVQDHKNNTNATVNGGIVPNTSMCANAQELPSVQFNGTTGFLSPSDASLHPGNTGSWGCVFKRRTTGSAQALMSGGTDDIYIGFDATDHLIVQKEGTGNAFISTGTYTDTTSIYHLVVTQSAANGAIAYINGNSVTGTQTARTLVAGSGALQIGRKKSTADTYFAGRLWGMWVSSSEFSAATVLAQARIWFSMEPENLVIDRDSSDTTQQVWVKGGHDDKQKGNGTGTGYVSWTGSADPNFERIVGPAEGGPVLAQEFIDRPDSDNTAKRQKYANSYMSAKAGTIVSATFMVSYDPQYFQRAGTTSTWRPGQTVYITSSDAQGLSNYPLEIKQVDVDLLNASGETQYTISAGALPYSGLRKIRSVQSRGMA